MHTDMENWAEIRRRVLLDGQSKRSICREFGIHWDTLKKILDHPEPPGYRRAPQRAEPKLDPFLPVIPEIVATVLHPEGLLDELSDGGAIHSLAGEPKSVAFLASPVRTSGAWCGRNLGVGPGPVKASRPALR